MKSNLSYLIVKNKDSRRCINSSFKELSGYKVIPKKPVIRDNMIKVNQMNVIDPDLIEKLLCKKIEKKIEMLIFKIVNIMDSDDDGDAQMALTEAERIKYILVNEYSKFLDEEYIKKTTRKLQIIVNELKVRMMLKYQYTDVKEEVRGKSR
mgnify:FL=1